MTPSVYVYGVSDGYTFPMLLDVPTHGSTKHKKQQTYQRRRNVYCTLKNVFIRSRIWYPCYITLVVYTFPETCVVIIHNVLPQNSSRLVHVITCLNRLAYPALRFVQDVCIKLFPIGYNCLYYRKGVIHSTPWVFPVKLCLLQDIHLSRSASLIVFMYTQHTQNT